MELLSLAEDTEQDIGEHRVGPQQVTALEGATGNVDKGAFFWDEAEWS